MSQSDQDFSLSSAQDPLISRLQSIIKLALKALAMLMAFVIVWGILDVLLMLYDRLFSKPYLLLNISDILATFGAFMAVLIAVEIFVNISMYLEEGVLHVELVIATALMAAARKVIVMDFKHLEATYIFALGVVILSLGLIYWLLKKRVRSWSQGRAEDVPEPQAGGNGENGGA